MTASAPRRVIQIGVGGFGRRWINEALPPNIADGTIELVGIADTDPAALAQAQKDTGLANGACFASAAELFSSVKADFCIVVVPPETHEEIIDLAVAHDMDILCEKPIADTMAASIRIENKVRKAGLKMAVTMTHRFDQHNTTFRGVLKGGSLGQLDYLVFRLTGQLRRLGSWGHFRHAMKDPMLIEGSVHHLDIIADLAGAKCSRIYAQTWNPKWGEYQGDSQVQALLTFENGVHASYEGTCTNAVALNPYYKGYVRAECENATLILQHGRVERFDFEPDKKLAEKREGTGAEIALAERKKWANAWLVEQFAAWSAGGQVAPTNVESNLQTQAMVFAAIESGRTGQAVDVQRFLANETDKALGAPHMRSAT